MARDVASSTPTSAAAQPTGSAQEVIDDMAWASQTQPQPSAAVAAAASPHLEVPTGLPICDDSVSTRTHETPTVAQTAPERSYDAQTVLTPTSIVPTTVTLTSLHTAQMETRRDVLALKQSLDQVLVALTAVTASVQSHQGGGQSMYSLNSGADMRDAAQRQPHDEMRGEATSALHQHAPAPLDTPEDALMQAPSSTRAMDQTMRLRPVPSMRRDRSNRHLREVARAKALARFEVDHGQTPPVAPLTPMRPTSRLHMLRGKFTSNLTRRPSGELNLGTPMLGGKVGTPAHTISTPAVPRYGKGDSSAFENALGAPINSGGNPLTPGATTSRVGAESAGGSHADRPAVFKLPHVTSGMSMFTSAPFDMDLGASMLGGGRRHGASSPVSESSRMSHSPAAVDALLKNWEPKDRDASPDANGGAPAAGGGGPATPVDAKGEKNLEASVASMSMSRSGKASVASVQRAVNAVGRPPPPRQCTDEERRKVSVLRLSSEILEGSPGTAHNPLGNQAGFGGEVLLPTAPWRVAFDVLVYISVVSETMFASYCLAVLEQSPSTAYSVLILISFPIFVVWIALNFRTVIVARWKLFDTPAAIRKHYMTRYFAVDAVLAFPWDMAFSLVSPLIFRCCVFLRLGKACVVPRLLNTTHMASQRPFWARLLINAYLWAFVAHIAACSWLYTADWATMSDATYTDDTPINVEEDRLKLYIASLYWSLATLTSTGYGDISAETTETRGLSLFWMCFGVLVIIFTGARLTEWMVVTDPFALAEIDKKRKLCALMSKHNIPWDVQKSALRVFPVVLDATCQNYSSIIEELPQFLQEEIRLHIKLRLFERSELFRKLSTECLKAVVQVTVPEEYRADQNIVEHGEAGAEMFFLEQGLVEVYTYDEHGREVWIANLKGGSHFGESALISNRCRRTATVRAVTDCSLYALPKSSFDCVAELYPELKEVVWCERSVRLRRQGHFWGIMLRKTIAMQLYCTPRESDSDARVMWRMAVRRVLETRCQDLMDEAEEDHYRGVLPRTNSTIIPSRPSLRRRRHSEHPIEGTFIEQIDFPHPEDLEPPQTTLSRHGSSGRCLNSFRFAGVSTEDADAAQQPQTRARRGSVSFVPDLDRT